VLTDTTGIGDIAACRHANGRDWWVIKSGLRENRFYVGLLNPDGIEMEEIIVPGADTYPQMNAMSYFSFDGSKFIHWTGGVRKFLYAYDFDRCSGTLANPIIHDLSDSLLLGDFNPGTISPDGSKFYVTRSSFSSQNLYQATLQYDMNNSQFTNLTRFAGASFLMPNGKAMIFSSYLEENDSLTFTLSIIKNPNQSGLACDVELHKYTVLNSPVFVAPSNYANFRLGPIDGSSCDTLGINNLAEVTENKQPAIKIYPNPAKESFTIAFNENAGYPLTIKLMNCFGHLLLEKQVNETPALIDGIGNLPSGIYLVQVNNKDGEIVGVEKLVIQK